MLSGLLMEAKPLPELQWLAALTRDLLGSSSGAPAMIVVSTKYAAITETTPAIAFQELYRAILSLPALIAEMPPGGTRTVASKVVERFQELLDPETLSLDFNAYVKKHRTGLIFIDGAIAVLEDFRYDGSAFLASEVDLYAALAAMKDRFGAAESLSDASKTVLNGQLDLLAACVQRFQTSGVGPFRASVFSVYGRIKFELENDSKLRADDKKAILDDLLRWYDLAEAGGSLLRLGGTVISGLLT